MQLLSPLLLAVLARACSLSNANPEKTCHVSAAPHGTDSAPAIVAALERCGRNAHSTERGRVVFGNETYTVKSVMNTTGLAHLDIDLHGTLEWDTNLSYWLNHSLPVGYQNQSSAWLFGGEDIHWNGFNYGTLNGNGQAWYNFINGTNNYPGRPHQITITGTSNSTFEGIRFVQSQMWTMTVIHSENILLQDIYINSTDTEHPVGFDFSSLNTDGADTIYANNITFRRWLVDNGDDSISFKANSTNILVEDCEFYTGLGLAVGSIGQYNGVYEIIENITVHNIIIHENMRYGAYVKTWTGISTGFPPNGGGGGLGHASNITFEDFKFKNASGVFALTQCTSYNGATGGCDTSLFNIHNLTIRDWSGIVQSDVNAEMQCSGDSPCTGITIEGINLVDSVNNTRPSQYLCSNVEIPIGFNCTGAPYGENPR